MKSEANRCDRFPKLKLFLFFRLIKYNKFDFCFHIRMLESKAQSRFFVD